MNNYFPSDSDEGPGGMVSMMWSCCMVVST